MDKHKLDVDKKLISTLFGFDPMDWARRDNGDLVILNTQGQKFVYSDQDIKVLIDKKLAEKDRSVPQGRNAKIPVERQPQAASAKGTSDVDPGNG